MSFNFFVIGGDMRMFFLAKKLKEDGHNISVVGFEKIKDKCFEEKINLIEKIDELQIVINDKDIIVSSIPFTLDDENIYAPYSSKPIKIKNLIDKRILNDKRKFIAGKIPYYVKGYDILENEKITIYNTIATAEGAISKAVEESYINLTDSNVLVLGFGRVAKTLCNKLKGIGANVYCEARKEADLAWIKTLGYKPIHIKDLNKYLYKMNFIFNTIPSLMIDKEELMLINKKTLIIDLASKPGGVNFDLAEKLEIKAILYSGIPGKIAPESSANYIKGCIYELLKNIN